MRQVPHYLIIGNGCMAKHTLFYLNTLNLPYTQWFRQQGIDTLTPKIQASSHVLILLPDQSIDPFIEAHKALQDKQLIHFSGSLLSRYAHSTHPLQTFTSTLFKPDSYTTVPFIIEAEGPDFQDLLPGLHNPHHTIPRAQKPYYHSLCVMANNFTTLLWQKFFNSLENQLNIPHEAGLPLLEQTLTNLKTDYTQALTGPLVRKDFATLRENLAALQANNDSYADLFESFLNSYLNLNQSPSTKEPATP